MSAHADAGRAAEEADTIHGRAFEFACHTLDGAFPPKMWDVIRRAVGIGVDYGLEAARAAPSPVAAPADAERVALLEGLRDDGPYMDGEFDLCLNCGRDFSEAGIATIDDPDWPKGAHDMTEAQVAEMRAVEAAIKARHRSDPRNPDHHEPSCAWANAVLALARAAATRGEDDVQRALRPHTECRLDGCDCGCATCVGVRAAAPEAAP